MASSVYIFNKTFEQRLDELKVILCSGELPVPASEVADEWSYCLENFIEPTGWQALWKISRQICEELTITFPKFVFVKVLRVDFRELTALIEIESMQEDLSIPIKQEVPLTQLYPTKLQEDPHLNVDYTANFIDHLRFFYNHIWCPWDAEDTEGGDWPSKYLEARVKLFFEMNDGSIPAKLAGQIHKKKEQARKLFEQKQELELQLRKVTEDGVNAEDIDSPVAEELTFKLMQIHLQLNPLIAELQLVQNSSMRKLMLKNFLEENVKKHQSSDAIIVWQGGQVDGFMNFLAASKHLLDEKTCTLSASSLPNAIESAVSGNTIFLYQGIHEINEILEDDLCIIGVDNSSPKIIAKENHSFLLSARNAKIKLKNVNLSVKNVASVLQVLKSSTVELINCSINNEDAVDGRGIVVHSGGSVLIDGCSFSGLHVAVCCYSGSRVCIKNSTLADCVFGVEVNENSEFQIEGGSVAHCREAGLFISQSSGVDEKGGLELLKKFQNIRVSELQLVKNAVDIVLKTESKAV